MTLRTSVYRMVAVTLLCCCSAACGGGGDANEEAKEGTDGAMKIDSSSVGAVATDDAAASETTGPDVCKLLSAQEASDILGFNVADGASSNGNCSYQVVPPSMAMLVVTKVSGPGAYDILVSDTWEPVSGVGDKAAASTWAFVFQKGNDVISISIANPKVDYKAREPLTKIAQKIHGRL